MLRPFTYLSVLLLFAGLVAGCGGGGTNTPTLPSINLNASTQHITAGQGVTIAWSTSNATSVESASVDAFAVNGAETLFPMTTTTYSVTAYGGGRSTSASVTIYVTPAQAPAAVSGFGCDAFSGGEAFPVYITVTPSGTTMSYAVEDMPPTGWMVTNINNGGLFDSVHHKVKWGLFNDATPRILSYTITPPSYAFSDVSFSGTVSLDGTNFPIIGDRYLGVRVLKKK